MAIENTQKSIIPVFAKIVIPVFLFAVFAAQALHIAWHQGQTTDETFYNGSGYALLRYHNYHFIGEHPPLSMHLGTLPLLFLQPHFPIDDPVIIPGDGHEIDLSRTGAKFLYKSGNNPQVILFLERAAIIAAALFLGFLIFRTTRQLYGNGAALWSLALFALSPNILSHASVFTSDMTLTVFYFATACAFSRFLQNPSSKNAAMTGLAAGLAFLSKMSALALIPSLGLSLALVFLLGKNEPVRAIKSTPSFLPWVALGLFIITIGNKVVMVALGPLILIGLAEMGQLKKPFAEKLRHYLLTPALCVGWILTYVFAAKLFHKYNFTIAAAALAWVVLGTVLFTVLLSQKKRPVIASLKPLIAFFLFICFVAVIVIIFGFTDFFLSVWRYGLFNHFVRTFNIASSHALSHHIMCPDDTFISCDWRYFLGMLTIKTPVVTLFTSLAGIALLFRRRCSLSMKTVLFVFPGVFLFLASFLNNINIGLRHVLPLFPFLLVYSGAFAEKILNLNNTLARRAGASLLVVMICFHAFMTFRWFPDYLSYFNEFVKDTAEGARLAGDSNINWGQDNKLLALTAKEEALLPLTVYSSSRNEDIYRYYSVDYRDFEDSDYTDPSPGYYAVGIEVLDDITGRENSWFKGKKPFKKVGRTYTIYRVPE